MSQWKLANVATKIYVEFKKDGEFVIPDAGSILLTIRGNSGAAIGGYNGVQLADVTGTTLLYTVQASVNLIPENTTESRYVSVSYTSDGVPLTFNFNYRLSGFLPITVQPQDVRNILGVRDLEVRDEDVDLHEAYFDLLRTNSTLSEALTSVTGRANYANRAIALKSALTLLPSMPVRALKEDALNNATQIRATIDWEALKVQLEDELSKALENLAVDVEPETSLPVLFALVTPTDPVTNA